MISTFALSLDDAKMMAAAARAEATRRGWTVVIAVVDDGGHLIYLERMDGTQKASSVVAQEKARSAVLFKRSTKTLEQMASDRPATATLPGATMVEGGLPIVHRDSLVGAIGISGAHSSEDGIVAQAGLDALPG